MTPSPATYLSLSLDELTGLERADFRSRFEPVYHLAHSFVLNKRLAIEIGTAVLLELPTLSQRQDARFSFTPKGAREKPWMPDSGNVQRLVYRRVEPYEHNREQSGRALSFNAWTRSFIKHLNWIALQGGNSAWTAVSRSIIFQMTARQTADAHAVVAQNEDRLLSRIKEEDSIRAQRGVFMRSLKKRFAGRLQVMTAAHGEKRFLDFRNPKLTYPQSWPLGRPELTAQHTAIVRSWLRRLTPWVEKAEGGFSYAGHDPDIEQYCDLERMRMLFDPDDLELILNAAELPKLQDCLIFPSSSDKFESGEDDSNDFSAPVLTDDEIDTIRRDLELEADLRKSRALDPLLVLADGKEYATLRSTPCQINLTLPEGTEAVQVVRRSGVGNITLATHLITYGDFADKTATTYVALGGSDTEFSFTDRFQYDPERDVLTVKVDVNYQRRGQAGVWSASSGSKALTASSSTISGTLVTPLPRNKQITALKLPTKLPVALKVAACLIAALTASFFAYQQWRQTPPLLSRLPGRPPSPSTDVGSTSRPVTPKSLTPERPQPVPDQSQRSTLDLTGPAKPTWPLSPHKKPSGQFEELSSPVHLQSVAPGAITIPSSTATGIGLAAAANYKVAQDSQWKDYEDVVIVAALNGLAKAAGNNGQVLTTATYASVANQLRTWLDMKSPQNPIFTDEAACLRYAIDSMVPVVSASPASPLLQGVLNGLENLKLTQLETPIDPTRQYPADLASSSISATAYQFIADRIQEASDLAHNDAQYAAAVNPVLSDLLGVASTASYAQIQSLYPSALPTLPAPNADGSFTINAQSLLSQYQSLVSSAQAILDADLTLLASQSSSSSASVANPRFEAQLQPLASGSTLACATANPLSLTILTNICIYSPSSGGNKTDPWTPLQSDVTGISKLVGLADPQLASQITTVGGGIVQAGKAIEQIANLAGATGSIYGDLPPVPGVLNPMGAVAGAAVQIFGLFGGGAGSSNPNAAVVAQIQKLSQQITKLQQDVDAQFMQVNATLHTILVTLNQNFALINYQLGVLNGDAHAIQVGLLDVQTQPNQLAVYSLAYAQTQDYETLVQYLNGCLNYRTVHNGADIGLSQYNTCENELFTWANNDVTDQLWAGVQQPDYSDGNIYNIFLNSSVAGVCWGCASPFSTDINYLAQFPAQGQNVNLPPLATGRLSNPEMWTLVARAYLQLAREWPQYRVTINSAHFDDLIQVGASLQQAIHKANSTGSGGSIVTNQPLFNAVVNKYNAAIPSLQTALQNDLNSYIANPANGITNSNGITLNLFAGGANQQTYWRPSIGSIGYCSGGGSFAAPASVLTFVPDLYAFSQGYLGSGQLSICISQAQWANLHTATASESFDKTALNTAAGDPPYPNNCPGCLPTSVSWAVGNLSITINALFNSNVVLTASATSSALAQAATITWTNIFQGFSATTSVAMNANTALPPSWTSGVNIQSQLNNSPQITQQPQPQLLSGIAAQIDAVAAIHQKKIYGNIAADFGAATPVQASGQLLSGSKLLAQAYANFGLPGYLQTNDSLHGLLYGSGSILDASTVQSDFAGFSTSTISKTTDNKITDEIALLNSRSSALAAAFTTTLGQIQQSGIPDSLAQTDSTLADLQAFETLKNASALSSCTYQLSSPSGNLALAGGSITLTVNSLTGCPVRPSTSASWLSIGTQSLGAGQSRISITATPDTNGSPRSGVVIVADQVYRVFQGVNPALSITATHSGNFAPGQVGATYMLVVSNQAVEAPTEGTVTVTDTIPAGLTLTSMAGTGWICSSNTCAREDTLNGAVSFPAITVTVNVASNAPAQVTNQVSVSGGGSATANDSDVTAIVPLQPPAKPRFVGYIKKEPPRNCSRSPHRLR